MTTLNSKLLSRTNLDFLLYDWLEAEAMTERERFADHDRATFSTMIDTAEKIATDWFANHNAKGDKHEPYMEDGKVVLIPEIAKAYGAFRDAGFLATTNDAQYGGLQLPFVIDRACIAYFLAANIATSGYAFLTCAAANLLLAHGTPEQIDRFALPMLAGRFTGTMCMSEPQAGSSLGDIRTRAELQPDGSYRLFGTKMWISGGDHELSETIVHLVLARTGPAEHGVRGLSLFIVPKHIVRDGNPAERNDIALVGLNHKMGNRATTNCVLSLGDGQFAVDGQAGAVGYRIGEENRGLSYMFHMMNEARIVVGLGAVMLGYTGYLHAVQYARDRPQGRALTQKGGDPVAIIQHADVRQMLLTQKAYVEGGLALCLYLAKLLDDQSTGDEETARRAYLLLDLLTPIGKSWPAKWCLEANNLAIQVHGGAGYTHDFPVEQFYRDNRINAIHEGTHGIQALDLLGRKVLNGEAIAYLDSVIDDRCTSAARSANPDTQEWAKRLRSAWQDIQRVTEGLSREQDVERRLANAGLYLDAFGHVIIAWIWLEQVDALDRATDVSEDFILGKRQAARYFFDWELPKINHWLAILERLDSTALEMQDSWF
ncbi:acyl-CoA dehydrogenase [Sphingobium indicum]|uniref:Acyl-CoA dehydrogenase n=2 Tax=Sphingobium indicum TaxID=332055 RepID=A0A1L5BS63_SPHIB|nr:acyl-CoA dehydrogenase [Sphingobium indicum]APL95724.1 acyl-CoA dehydrogenase [Sphingobium indicum B90A]NYI23947.1 alkylation response protein AidB-like acyl-CoA dehydrogenase [Sphingobium indicum]RYM00096.1 acyl-CoA dehydrogenase [Sphingobium indicum]